MLKNLNHPNVVKYYDLIETVKAAAEEDLLSTPLSDSDSAKTGSSLASYRSVGDGKIYLVMEWLGDGSNLTQAKLDGVSLKSVLRQLLSDVAYLCQQGIAHHDIKPDNIIYCPASDKLTLIDFGVAERCENDRSFCGFGTPAYQPPELVKRTDPEAPISGEKADLWAVGAVAFQLCTGALPFEGDSIHAVFEEIIKHEPNFSLITDTRLKSLIKGNAHMTGDDYWANALTN